MSYSKSDFYYDLPKRLIAQTPTADRSASRLLVLDKDTGRTEHGHFRDVLNYLRKGDCLVLNETKVIPARLLGRKQSGAAVELLLLKNIGGDVWEALAKPGRKARPGDVIRFGSGSGSAELAAEVLEVTGGGERIVRFEYDGVFQEILYALGETPLPPYITEKLGDKTRYQTVYAKNEGSAAAPTAGLHFTQELLAAAEAMGVSIARLTLHIGLGTFRPVKADNILDHHMHAEDFFIEQAQADIINSTRASGGRVISVGTTVCRALESCASPDGFIPAVSGSTDIFIYPGYRFKAIDALITNFHLPESTLVMLVSALAGREAVLSAYREAVAMDYRFFSFGDAMLIQ